MSREERESLLIGYSSGGHDIGILIHVTVLILFFYISPEGEFGFWSRVVTWCACDQTVT